MDPARGVEIIVTPLIQDGNNVACEIDTSAGNSSNVKCGIVKLKNGKSYELEFELAATNVLGLRFPPDGDDAFWCSITQCPTEPSDDCGEWLCNPAVSNQGLTLSVQANPPAGNKGLIFYRLNFDNGGSFDPIIIHE